MCLSEVLLLVATINDHQSSMLSNDDDVNDDDGDEEAGVHVHIFICTFPLLVFGAERWADVQRSR